MARFIKVHSAAAPHTASYVNVDFIRAVVSSDYGTVLYLTHDTVHPLGLVEVQETADYIFRDAAIHEV